VTKTILVVDDKANVRLLLEDYLTEQGFRVVMADNGRNALYTARYIKPDLILLDIMMPEMDGYQFITQHRREAATPIIVITAKTEETDAVLGLELGADDFVVKPFRMRELVSRIRAVLRRREAQVESVSPLQVGDIRLDPVTYTVTVRGEPGDLTPTEFDLLAIFMGAPGRVFTRELLFDRLSEGGFTGLERTINVHIRNLRTKIELDPGNPFYIETIFGVGYRFRQV
jgi:DNA-binding response OmpR family regulator